MERIQSIVATLLVIAALTGSIGLVSTMAFQVLCFGDDHKHLKESANRYIRR